MFLLDFGSGAFLIIFFVVGLSSDFAWLARVRVDSEERVVGLDDVATLSLAILR